MWHFLLLSVALHAAAVDAESAKGRRFYCDLNDQHTLCKYRDKVAPSCGTTLERGLSKSEQDTVVRLHNEKRARVANGEESKGRGGPQPSAANMMELTWDDELAAAAQAWAERCTVNHDCSSCRKVPRFKVGQNLYQFGYLPMGTSWEMAVGGWYDEVKDFNGKYVKQFPSSTGAMTGHYTQVVWGTTTKIGCGRMQYKPSGSKRGKEMIICNYGKAGNFIRQEMYKEGRACSDCPSGTSCSKRYKGLCTGDPGGAAPEPVNPDENPDENETKPSPKPNPSTKPSQKPDPDRSDCDGNCKYECKPNDGGCKVRYKNYGSGYSGSISGYCWSEKFGGECDGTPHCCKKCKEWCEEEKGTSEENEITPTTTPKPNSKPSTTKPDKSKNGRCVYDCAYMPYQCSVRKGRENRQCFSSKYGGFCIGTVNGCAGCKGHCKKRG